MRIADCVGYRALGKLIVLLIFLPRTRSQKFPTTDEDDSHTIYDQHRPELYYDTGILPYEREVTDYLRRNVSKEVFINVEKDRGPTDLKLTITPCASNVEVTVSRNSLPPSAQRNDKPKSRDAFLDQALRTQLGSSRPRPEVLASFQAASRQELELRDAAPGVFKVQMQARDSDTYVKVHLTAQPHSPAYPPLPAQPQVQVVSVSKSAISVRWEPVTDGRGKQYCVSLSRDQNFASHCAALSHLHGDKPPRLPSSVGFGFAHEKEKQLIERQRARPRKPAPKGRVSYECVGSKTSYTFSGLRPGSPHFLDVFVLDSATNMSSAYRGTSVSTEERAPRKRKVLLREGERAAVTVQRPKDIGEQVAVVFRVQDKLPQALLEVTSCRGKLTFDIYHRDKLVYRSTVRRRKLVHVKHMPPGPYFVKFSSRRRRSKATVYFTSNPSAYRPPRLPKDKRVRAYENLTTCSNVTLAWVATRLKQRYCVYRREVTGPRDARRSKRLSCAASRGRSRGDRVRCVRVRAVDRDRAVMTTVVTGLKPDTQYQFDVYVSRGRGTARSYVSLLTRTKAQC